jgi:hypothetical protein
MWSSLVAFITLAAAATALEQLETSLLASSPQSCLACKLTTNLYTEELLKFLTAKTDGNHRFAVDNGVVLEKTCKNDAFSGYAPWLKEVCCS